MINPAEINPAVSPRAARCFPKKGKHRKKPTQNAKGVFWVGFFAEGGGAQGNCRVYFGRVEFSKGKATDPNTDFGKEILKIAALKYPAIHK